MKFDQATGLRFSQSIPVPVTEIERHYRDIYVPEQARLGTAALPLERVAEGFHARVVQHECDHLDGILYPMRMRDMTRFGYTDVLFPGVPDAEE